MHQAAHKWPKEISTWHRSMNNCRSQGNSFPPDEYDWLLYSCIHLIAAQSHQNEWAEHLYWMVAARLHFVSHGLLIADSSEFTKRESCAIIRRMHIFGTMIGIIHIAWDMILRVICIDENQSFVVTGRLFYLFKGIIFCFLGLLWRWYTYFSQFRLRKIQLGSNLSRLLLP